MMRKRRKKKNSYGLGLGFSKIEISDDIKKDMLGIFILALAAINILSFVNLAGGLGSKIKEIGELLFGIVYYISNRFDYLRFENNKIGRCY
jgi:hypothetical protein